MRENQPPGPAGPPELPTATGEGRRPCWCADSQGQVAERGAPFTSPLTSLSASRHWRAHAGAWESQDVAAGVETQVEWRLGRGDLCSHSPGDLWAFSGPRASAGRSSQPVPGSSSSEGSSQGPTGSA